MMASNLLSRILPPSNGAQSIYEAIRDQEEAAARSVTTTNERAQAELDEQNLGERFRDEDIDLIAEAMESRQQSESPELTDLRGSNRPLGSEREAAEASSSRPRWLASSTRPPGYRDDDVSPETLLLEDIEAKGAAQDQAGPSRDGGLPPPVPGPSNRQTRVQWDTTRHQQQLYEDDLAGQRPAYHPSSALHFADPVDKAMWRWTNVENLDNFLTDVYVYYIGKGIWSILLKRVIGMLTAAFVVALTVFLTSCVDYSLIPQSKRLPEVLVPKCTKNMSGFNSLLVWLFSFFWIIKLVDYGNRVRRLWHLHEFYRHLLHIPDVEIQTISWQEIVGRIMNLRDANPRTALNINPQSRNFIGKVRKESMDAHDIANRLMRKDNYYIALFNKDILDCTIPLPGLRQRRLFSKALEWNLNYCILDFVFNEQGQVKQIFLKDTDRQGLIDALKRRFILAGFINIISAPIVVVSILVLYFLRYFTEYQRDPSQAGARGYTPFAEWKFREFNELQHLFQRRLNMSYPFASRYLDQFPKDKTVQVAGFVRTVAGALATVLAVASLLDPDVFIGFEITPDRTVLFWLGILATIWATARGMVPDDELVFDPEYAINEVAQYTHYHPAHWRGRLHSDEVRQEFSELYRNKILIFLEEILGIIVTPFVLWFSLPQCSEQIVDFFREFTVHVDGLGYVCWFAHFNFKKPDTIQPMQAAAARPTGKKLAAPASQDLRNEYYSAKEDKMLSSYYTFLDSYAQNPRRKDHPPQGGSKQHRKFHPPPSFPGLASSPQLGPQGIQVDRRFGLERSVYNSPRHKAASGLSDPSPSLLLDPHHQPISNSTALRRPQAAAAQSHSQAKAMGARLRGAGRGSRAAEASASFRDSADNADVRGVESTIVEEDSHLGDSWKAAQAVSSAEASREEVGRDRQRLEEDGGVLGLLSQFTRAQADGRPGGVGI